MALEKPVSAPTLLPLASHSGLSWDKALAQLPLYPSTSVGPST